MEKLPMCRICLVENVRMYVVANKNLQEIYENLTDVPFVTKDSRPMLACFFCYTKLKQCGLLQRKCLKAEKLFAQMLNEDCKPNPLLNQGQLEFCNGFIISPTEQISIFDECQAESDGIKEELPDVCEGQDDIIEEEVQRDELELVYQDTPYLDCLTNQEDVIQNHSESEDIPPQNSESEDYVPSMEIITEVERKEEVLKKKRRANAENQEDMIPDHSEPEDISIPPQHSESEDSPPQLRFRPSMEFITQVERKQEVRVSRKKWRPDTEKTPTCDTKQEIKDNSAKRKPRTLFSQTQVDALEDSFRHRNYITALERKQLAVTVNLSLTQVMIWFQNKRYKSKRIKSPEVSTSTDAKPSKTLNGTKMFMPENRETQKPAPSYAAYTETDMTLANRTPVTKS